MNVIVSIASATNTITLASATGVYHAIGSSVHVGSSLPTAAPKPVTSPTAAPKPVAPVGGCANAAMHSVVTATDSDWANHFGGLINYVCPTGSAIVSMVSEYSSTLSDRRWKFKCAKVFGGDISVCKWGNIFSSDEWSAPVVDDGVITGLRAEYNSTSQDRTYQMKWCSMPGMRAVGEEQGWSQMLETFSYTAGADEFIGQLGSQHNLFKKDRIFRVNRQQFCEDASATPAPPPPPAPVTTPAPPVTTPAPPVTTPAPPVTPAPAPVTPHPTPALAPASDDEDCADCIIWGDPHIITFDVNRHRRAEHPAKEAFFRTRNWKTDELSITEEGQYWLVKSDTVQIQGLYLNNHTETDTGKATSLHALAISGPFVDDNLLVIRTLEHEVRWNKKVILPALGSAFKNKYIDASYHKGAELVANGKRGPGLDVQLPHGVSMVVNRWEKSLAVRIRMCQKVASGQEGQCGNNNHDTGDDTPEYLESKPSGRRVSKLFSLFPGNGGGDAFTI